MRTEIRVVLFSAAFVGGLAVVYWFTSYEDAGTTMLALASCAYAMLCGYLYLQVRKFGLGSGTSSGAGFAGGPTSRAAGGATVVRPSDTEDPVGSGGGSEEIGYFPASSVWPPAMAMGAVLAALGLVFGFWFLVIGAIFFVGAIVGYAVEAAAPH